MVRKLKQIAAEHFGGQLRFALHALYLHIRIIGHFLCLAILVIFFAPIAALLTLRLDAAIKTVFILLRSLDLRLPGPNQHVVHFYVAMILQLTIGILISYLMTLSIAISTPGSRIITQPRKNIFRNRTSNSLLLTICFLIGYATCLLLALSFECAVGFFSALILAITGAFVTKMTWAVRKTYAEVYDCSQLIILADHCRTTTRLIHVHALSLQTRLGLALDQRVLEPSRIWTRNCNTSYRITMCSWHHRRLTIVQDVLYSENQATQRFLEALRSHVCILPASPFATLPLIAQGPWLHVDTLYPEVGCSITGEQQTLRVLRQTLSARAPPPGRHDAGRVAVQSPQSYDYPPFESSIVAHSVSPTLELVLL